MKLKSLGTGSLTSVPGEFGIRCSTAANKTQERQRFFGDNRTRDHRQVDKPTQLILNLEV